MPEDLLYHYTTFPGFHGIVASRKIWASSIHFLNDSTEFNHGLKLFAARAKKRFEPNTAHHLTTALERIERLSIFVASFSKKSDLLSQWRAYCNPYGIAVGFSAERLVQIAAPQGFDLVDCVYDDVEKNKRIDELLDRFETKDVPALGQERAISNFVALASRIAAAFKHSSFHEEDESRLLSRPIPIDDPDCLYRPTSSLIIPTYRINLDINEAMVGKKSDIGIRIIKMGPNPHYRIASDGCTNYCIQSNVHWQQCDISNIPYRQF